jgi:integrase
VASVYKPSGSKKYKITYRDHTGRLRKATGTTDKSASQQIANDFERTERLRAQGLVDPKAERYRDHEARPIAEHVVAFQRALASKGGSKRHPEVTASRALKVLGLAKVGRISNISLSAILDALKMLRDEGLSGETINHHVRAVKGFSRFLHKDGRAREHALAHLPTAHAQPTFRRRELTPEECVRLIKAAQLGRTTHKLSGPDRAILYELALGTGFRANELRSLTTGHFNLESEPPTVTVRPEDSKNGKEAVQPISRELAERLRPWLDRKTPGTRVFGDRLTDRTAEMLRVDLKAAGIPYETASGIVDFHGTRVTYVSDLVSSGASVKTCQTLARHSTPSLTIGIYAKASLHDINGAVESLPSRGSGRTEPEMLAATGTDNVFGSGATESATRTLCRFSQDDMRQGVTDCSSIDLKSFGG